MKHFLAFFTAFLSLSFYAAGQILKVPLSGTITTTLCSGTVQDIGGANNYSNNNSGSLVINPPGNAPVSIYFTEFNTSSNDILYIYNGVGTTGNLVAYCTGNSLPSGGSILVSTSDAITLRFVTNGTLVNAGFTAIFSSVGNLPPVASFTVSTTTPAYNVPMLFTNTATNSDFFLWLFGDGTTSTDPNPTHAYTVAGAKQVRLVTNNCSGTPDTSAVTNIFVQAAPAGSISVDTVKISVPCGGTNSTTFNIANTGSGNLNFNLNLVPSANSANFIANFEGTGLNGFVNLSPTIYSTTLKTNNPPQGNQYLELVGDGYLNDGLKANFTTSQPNYVSYYVKTENSANTNGIVEIRGKGANNVMSRIFSSNFIYGQLRLYYGYFSSTPSSNHNITLGQWNHIELKNINYTTQKFDVYLNGLMVLNQASFISPINGIEEIQIYNTFQATIGVDAFYIGNTAGGNGISYNPSSGVLANGNNVNVFINASAIGLNAGVYWMNFVVSSNDTALNGLVIPIKITVTGTANLVQSALCKNYGNKFTSSVIQDSILMANTGCDTLQIASLTTSSARVLVQNAPFSLPPNDSIFLRFTFSPNQLGANNDTIYFTGPDTNSYLCLSAFAAAAPHIVTDSTAYHITYNGCPDTVSFNMTIANPGNAGLNWGATGAIASNRTDDFEGTVINPALWASWTTGVSQGTSCGVITGSKSLIFDGSGARSIQTVPLNTTGGGTLSFKYSQSSCEFSDSGEGLYVYFSTNNGQTWTQIQYLYTTLLTTQIATMPLPVAAQGQGVIFRITQNSNSGVAYDLWTIDDFSISSNLLNTMIFAPDTGAIAPNGSTSVLVKIAASGLTSGVHQLVAYITSNDPNNPLLSIPVVLTINGVATLSHANICKPVPATTVLTTTQDSIQIWNSGCDSLVISGATFQTSNFTASVAATTVAIGDTAFLKFSFSPQTMGTKTDSMVVATNAGTYTICVTGLALGAPIAVGSTTPINIMLNSCTDSTTINYTLGNTGQGPLNYKFTGSGNDTIKILVLTLGMSIPYYNNALAALNTYLNKPYVITQINTSVPAVLTAQLVGKDLLWLPSQSTAQYAGYTNLGPAIRAYLSAGGKMIVHGTGYTSNIFNMGVINGYHTRQDLGGTTVIVNPLYTADPIVQFVPSTNLITPNKAYYFDISNVGKRQLLRNNAFPTEDFVTEVPFGQGKALYFGFHYNTTNSMIDQILANAIRSYGNANGGSYASWLTIKPDSGVVAVNNTQTISFKFKANNLGSGTYQDTVVIETNDPLHPEIKIPVTLTINGKAGINVTSNCVPFGTTYVGLAKPISTNISNPGCDTLVISGFANSSGHWSLPTLPLKIAPKDTLGVNLLFLPTAMGTFADTIFVFSNADTVKICVTGQGLGAPLVNPALDTLKVTINKCDGFKIVPFTMQNSGQGSMTYAMDAYRIYENQSTLNYTTLNATTTHTFNNTPLTADTIFFMIVVNGNFAQAGNSELYTVRAENYNLYINDNNKPDGTNDTSYGYYTGPNITNWLADGKLIVTVQNGSGVDLIAGSKMHHVYVRMRSNTPWLTFLTPKTGSLAPAASTTKNLLFTATNLAVGVYQSNVIIKSNDPLNPLYNVPAILTVVEKPKIELAAPCISFGYVPGIIPRTDSVKLYNRGCTPLNITNLQFTNSIFSSTKNNLTIAAKDSAWLPVTITPTAAGNVNANVLLFNNDSTISLCLTAVISLVPTADIDFSVIDECTGKIDFSDNSTNTPNTWAWDFGDGQKAYVKSPTHLYQKPGTYTVQLIAGNSSGADTAYATVLAGKVLYGNFGFPDTIRAGVATQFYDSSQVATNWQWFFGDGGNASIQNPTHTYTTKGVYFVSLVASNIDCSKTINKQVTVIGGIGIEENITNASITIYPVPANQNVWVMWPENSAVVSVKIVNAQGQLLQEMPTPTNQLNLQTGAFSEGIYFVMLTDKNGLTGVKKFVIAR